MGSEPLQVVSIGTQPIQISPAPTSAAGGGETGSIDANAHQEKATAPIPIPQSAIPTATDSAIVSPTAQARKREPRNPRKTPGKLSPQERILRAIQAIIQHNHSCTDPHDQWFINRQIIAEMSGTNNQLYVKPIFDQPSDLFPDAASVQDAIDHHYHQMGLPNAQHNKRKDKEQIKDIYDQFQDSAVNT